MAKSKHLFTPGNLLPLMIVGLLPFLLGIIFSYITARQNVKQDLEIAALVMVHQAESISRQAWDMVSALRTFEGNSCALVSARLVRLGTLSPYFRSLGLTLGPNLYCSSVSGDVLVPLSDILQYPLPSPPPAAWNVSLRATRGVQERPAVIFARLNASSFGTFAIVDGQYLIDFMNAMGISRQYQLTIQFGDGYQIKQGREVIDNHPLFSPLTNVKTSSRYPITVRATLPASELIQSWRRAFLTFLPVALILALIFVSVVRSWQKRKMSLRDELRKGMLTNEFSVHYQPVYDMTSRCCVGVEALMRWYRPGGRSISPDVFITAAESEKMIIPLTLHLFELLAADVRHWQVPDGFHLGVNIAVEHIQHPAFVNDIRRLATMLAPHKLNITLELTERSLIANKQDVADKLTLLRREGFIIAVDDFGTGHCSLSYLQMFPLDYLKIDKGFVVAIGTADNDTPVLDAIIGLSKRLALDMVAEGVSSRHEYRYLKRCGVRYMQGYLYARPMDSRALMAWLRAQRRHLQAVKAPAAAKNRDYRA
ncbi:MULTISPECIES: EAL domain-containing protein [Brenneria]|uniref:cyclic-guanylate-specific phosphodiesterase n=1 Tax=Brenneria nigrifluens DSM 30175 = ATCC 13028 TaxID=1121120 RepID=A0A2U1UQY7_9GAMM|nr:MULTISPECIES: EAL domain-containing protein [Brenneria]EHD22236.1 EAL domain protein [Brenneria sp. EniD312]PWC24067.1 cyclic diguanylate phosphodiesterase [Brenneria nigrifluens DSM 30175 = ATCC 13028]QCR05260.1 EAL domain-containing protein [Brenneria nigrifluens DSM 30175 = ATCC 13028]